jgi:hypothetical protein
MQAPRRRLPEALVLAASAVVIVVAAAMNRTRSAAEPSASPASSTVTLGALPSGATARPASADSFDSDIEAGCHFPDRGFGTYLGWRPLPLGRLLIPTNLTLAADGGYLLLVHFHGAEPIRKELAAQDFNLVVAAVDAGVRSGAYDRALADDGVFGAMLGAVNREVAAAMRRTDVHPAHTALSSWSAGYGAVARILDRAYPAPRIEAVLLLDSLHAGYGPDGHSLAAAQIAPFLTAARDAVRGASFFYLTHSEIPTSGYASTSETASFLLQQLAVQPAEASPDPLDPLPLRRLVDEGRFFLRGYDGTDKAAHCAHLRLLPRILRDQVLPAFALE